MAYKKHHSQVELEGTKDFEVSPDLYTHTIITQAIQCIHKGLENNNFSSGVVALDISVDQLEQVLQARKILIKDAPYYAEVEEKEKNLKKLGLDDNVFNYRLSNFKLGRLMKIAFTTGEQEGELVV